MDDVSQSLRAHLDDAGRTLSSDGALFRTRSRSRHGHCMKEGAIRAVVEKYTGRVGIAAKKISPHSLRHTYALRQLKGGASETAISKLLGHASIATTQRYVDHLAVSDLRSDLVPLPTA